MLRLVWQKIFSNRWKTVCLLLGSALVVGMLVAIPTYVDGILQRMLTRDLEAQQQRSGRYPGIFAINAFADFVGGEEGRRLNPLIRQEFVEIERQMERNPLARSEHLRIPNLYIPVQESDDKVSKRSFSMLSATGIYERVTIVNGRMPSLEPVDGVIETMTNAAKLQESGLVLDKLYEFGSFREPNNSPLRVKIRITGVYEPAERQDVFWYQTRDVYDDSLIASPGIVENLYQQSDALSVLQLIHFASYDYHTFKVDDLPAIRRIVEREEKFAKDTSRALSFSTTFWSVIEQYTARAGELRLTLQILIVPVLLMLLFYIYMVSQLLVRSERANISVMESRGASRSQILLLFGIEAALISIVAYFVGAWLGFQMVRVIGAANGFLEFVGRRALPLRLTVRNLLYGAGAVLLILATTLGPVFVQARSSIVEQKRSRSRKPKPQLWKRLFLDVILLAIAGYGWYRLREQLNLQISTGRSGLAHNLDFLLFLASTLFILGGGLFFLRIYPLLLRLIFLIGRRFWNPVAYATFHQLSRSDGQEQFLMLFLILTLSVGLFNANAARTINRNAEDILRAQVGADLVVQETWNEYDQNGNIITPDIGGMGMPDTSGYGTQIKKYFEPDPERFERLPDVIQTARVLRQNSVRIERIGTNTPALSLLAVDPIPFAKTAWFRSDLSTYHLNEYMNRLAMMPKAIILSANLQEELGLKVGESIIYSVNNSSNIEGVILAFVRFWPGYVPQRLSEDGQSVTETNLIVANLDYVYSQIAMTPYEVWLKRSPEVNNDRSIYDGLVEGRIVTRSIRSANQLIAEAKNDPRLQGTNGALTLGFLVSMLICAVGFLIYWILAVRSRSLQFGIFRAMGLTRGAIVGMLIFEQILVSGVAIAIGTVIGLIGSALFVPLFQLVYSSTTQPIPFRVIATALDSRRIFIMLGALLAVCLAVLIRLVLSLRIDQAVKLGED